MLSRLAYCFRLRGLLSLRESSWWQVDLSVASGCQKQWSRGCRLGAGRFGCCSRIFLWAGAPSAYCLVMLIVKVVLADVARIVPYVSSSRRLRKKGCLPGNVRAKCMLFALKMAIFSSHVFVSGCNRAISDT